MKGKEFDREGVGLNIVGNFSSPVSSMAYIIDTVILRYKFNGSVVDEYELSCKAVLFSSFSDEGKLSIKLGGV
jgi:hypothetical protein